MLGWRGGGGCMNYKKPWSVVCHEYQPIKQEIGELAETDRVSAFWKSLSHSSAHSAGGLVRFAAVSFFLILCVVRLAVMTYHRLQLYM